MVLSIYGAARDDSMLVRRLNVKLGGINAILAPDREITFLNDDANPTLILGTSFNFILLIGVVLIHYVLDTGADVAHPAPGTDGRPSFTALVGSVDSNAWLAITLVSLSSKITKFNKVNMSLPTAPKHLGKIFD